MRSGLVSLKRHHIAQNKDRIHGFSKAPILLWHTVGSFFLHSLMAKSRSCPRMKLSRFIFMLGTLHKNLKEEHDSKHACKSFFSAPANQGLGRYKKYIYVYIWSRPLSLHPPGRGGGRAWCIYTVTNIRSVPTWWILHKKIKKVLRVSRTREGI